jgi:hypothetical protein
MEQIHQQQFKHAFLRQELSGLGKTRTIIHRGMLIEEAHTQNRGFELAKGEIIQRPPYSIGRR